MLLARFEEPERRLVSVVFRGGSSVTADGKSNSGLGYTSALIVEVDEFHVTAIMLLGSACHHVGREPQERREVFVELNQPR